MKKYNERSGSVVITVVSELLGTVTAAGVVSRLGLTVLLYMSPYTLFFMHQT